MPRVVWLLLKWSVVSSLVFFQVPNGLFPCVTSVLLRLTGEDDCDATAGGGDIFTAGMDLGADGTASEQTVNTCRASKPTTRRWQVPIIRDAGMSGPFRSPPVAYVKGAKTFWAREYISTHRNLLALQSARTSGERWLSLQMQRLRLCNFGRSESSKTCVGGVGVRSSERSDKFEIEGNNDTCRMTQMSSPTSDR